MRDSVARIAGQAAEHLAAEFGPRLLADVEAMAQLRKTQRDPEQYVIDPISLASLVVAAATLAWTVYTDLRGRVSNPAASVIERTVRLRLSETSTLNLERRDEIVEIVVKETMRVGSEVDSYPVSDW